jgi:osmotically-inducible protein OsmY
MFGGNDSSDKALQKAVSRRLERSGAGTRSGLNVSVQRGNVTLTGNLKYERQRLVIVKALRGVSGVRHVIDQLQSPPKKKFQGPQPGSA